MSELCSKNILIVEDDKEIREAMRDALEIEGYSVNVTDDGNEGLNYLRSNNNTCVILLDLLMPIMSGRDFMDIVQQDEKISSIPIFIHSSIANKENTKGAVGWIKKPADLELILQAVKNHCTKN